MLKTETLNLRVSVEFKRRLVEEARKEKRSVTNYIEAAITEFWSQRAPTTIRTKTRKGE
jgi:predicted HicB family RNase H-like nuclease